RDRAELRHVDRSVRRVLHAQRVCAGHVADRRAEHVRALGDGAADQDAARARALAEQLRGAGVAVLLEVFRAGDEVLPRVRLGGLVAGLLPVVALLAATPDVRG